MYCHDANDVIDHTIKSIIFTLVSIVSSEFGGFQLT